MDVFNDRIIDIGLNALGYLVAGGLGMLLYSVLPRRSRRPATEAATPAALSVPAAESDPKNTFEFVELRPSPVEGQGESKVDSIVGSKGGTARRDRREIIRLAREMLKAGTADEMVKRTLPISDGELALLHNGNLE